MRFRTAWVAASTFVCVGVCGAVATDCGLHIGDVVAPSDATSDGATSDALPEARSEEDTASACELRACDGDTHCCGASPRCSASGVCIEDCTPLDAACATFPCCFGLRCDMVCRPCNAKGEGCTIDSSCCSMSCKDGLCQ